MTHLSVNSPSFINSDALTSNSSQQCSATKSTHKGSANTRRDSSSCAETLSLTGRESEIIPLSTLVLKEQPTRLPLTLHIFFLTCSKRNQILQIPWHSLNNADPGWMLVSHLRETHATKKKHPRKHFLSFGTHYSQTSSCSLSLCKGRVEMIFIFSPTFPQLFLHAQHTS